MTRYLSLFILSVVVALFASAALAADWTVVRSSGDVWVGTRGVQPVSLEQGTTLAAGGLVTTGASGRVMLARGDQSMVIGPNSIVSVPDDSSTSAFTTILQRSGVVEFNVDKRKFEHFAVATPYLAAVVKGTHFVVTARLFSGTVDVTRGRVEVIDRATGKAVDVTAGQEATVTWPGGLKASSGDAAQTMQPSEARQLRTAGLAGISLGGSTGVSVNAAGVSVGVNAGDASASAGGLSGLLHALGL